MLEAVAFKDGTSFQNRIEVGAMVEAMLFYGTVHFLGNHRAYQALLDAIGAYPLLQLLEEGFLRIHVGHQQLGVRTLEQHTARERHSLTYIARVNFDPEKEAVEAFMANAGGEVHRQAAKRFFRKLHVVGGVPQVDLRTIRDEILKDGSIRTEVGAAMARMAPDALSEDWTWSAWQLAGDIQIGTNLNFNTIQRELKQRGAAPEIGATVAHLLAHYAEAYLDAYYAAQLNAEIRTGPFTTPIMERRFEILAARANKNACNIVRFNEAVFSNARAVGRAFEDGRLSIVQLIPALQRGARFRSWIADKPFGTDLLADYYRETVATTDVASLPLRSNRFIQATLSDTLAINQALSGKYEGFAFAAPDRALLERIASGWRPSFYIDGEIQNLLETKTVL
jgi:hypothetical protein